MEHEKLPGLRERKHAALKKRLIDTAIDLFLEHGYQATRIEDITTAADVSRRTFFHYFSAKDDIVTGRFVQQAEYLRETFLARPVEEPIWDSLRETCHALFVTYGVNKQRAASLRKLIYNEQALFARKYDFYLRAQAELIPAVQQRLGCRADAALLASVLVRSALAARDAAGELQAKDSERRTHRLMLEKAFVLARPAALDERRRP